MIMKKIFLSLIFVFTLGLLTSCGGGNPIEDLTALCEKIEKEGADYDKDGWMDVFKSMTKIQKSFYNSEPTKEEIREFESKTSELSVLCAKTANGTSLAQALSTLNEDEDFKQVMKELDDAAEKARSAAEEKTEE